MSVFDYCRCFCGGPPMSIINRSFGEELEAKVVTFKQNGTSGIKRQRRRSRKEDPVKEVKDKLWNFPEMHENILRDTGERAMYHADILRRRHYNKFGFVLDIAREASEFQQTHKGDKRKPIFKALGDRVNELAGQVKTDAYLEDNPDMAPYLKLRKPREKTIAAPEKPDGTLARDEGKLDMDDDEGVYVRIYPCFKDTIYW